MTRLYSVSKMALSFETVVIERKMFSTTPDIAAGIAQLVRAPDCGSGGRGFETHYPPFLIFRTKFPARKTGLAVAF